MNVETADAEVERIRQSGRLRLLGAEIGEAHEIAFDEPNQLILHRRRSLPYHANGMTLFAYDASGTPLLEKTYYSVGGGFVVDEDAVGEDRIKLDDTVLKYSFRSGDEMLRLANENGLSISSLMLENEKAWRTEEEIRAGLLEIWRVMQACVSRGMSREGILPGGLRVKRRAAGTARQLRAEGDPQAHAMEWATLYAMAVNEENAAGGRVVTAPTNGAAGIIPAVLHYYMNFVPGADEDGVVRFLLAAGAIGMLFKENASISGAEVGCQGEVGSACSMAAAPSPRCWAAPPSRWRTPPRSAWSTTSASPVTRSAGSCRSRASSATAWRPSRRSPPPRWRCAATAPTRSPRQGHQDHEGDRRRHEGQVQGDRSRRSRGQRHRMLT